MSQLSDTVKIFSLIGDSNINRHVNKTSLRANPSLKSAQVLSCGHIGIFPDILEKMKPEVNVCLISCLTNFITRAEGPATLSHRVEPVLQQIRTDLSTSIEDNPGRLYLLSPPMYRTGPTWYREGLPEVLTLFSQVFSTDRLQGLHLLPSFSTPDYEADGVHLTAYSGLEYIMHLFDASQELFVQLESSLDDLSVKACESTRVLEDRVMVLEQDHKRLNQVVEHKIATDCEFADFQKNERFEDSFLIIGTPRIPPDVIGKPWQDQAVKDVQSVLVILMGREFSIVFVQNATSKAPNAEVKYHVKMSSISDSSLIRKKFGSFFLGSKDARPDELKHINIKNRVTAETKTRIDVLKLLASRYRASNPEGKAQVISYDARPLIKITPPSSATDRRVKVYNYVEAVKILPCNFSFAEVSPIVKRLNPDLLGKVRSIFVVLSDDMFREILHKYDKKKTSSGSASKSPSSSSNPTTGANRDAVASVSPPGLVQARGGKSRSNKRGAPSELSSTSKK